MDDLPRVVPFPTSPAAEPFVETPRSRAYLLPPGAAPPADADAILDLPDGTRFAYAPREPGGPARALAVDPFARGNSFKPLHESDRALAAQLSIAASRRVDTGPESERVFVFLRGRGLIMMENGDVHRFEPHQVGVVPATFPARVWAQGPEDVLAIVLQPRGEHAERRTLAGELAKRRNSPG